MHLACGTVTLDRSGPSARGPAVVHLVATTSIRQYFKLTSVHPQAPGVRLALPAGSDSASRGPDLRNDSCCANPFFMDTPMTIETNSRNAIDLFIILFIKM